MEIYMHLQNNAKGDLDLFIFLIYLFIFLKLNLRKGLQSRDSSVTSEKLQISGFQLKKRTKKHFEFLYRASMQNHRRRAERVCDVTYSLSA